ncbi:hypothetical protein ED92_20460 [Amycolatopsis sp. MJM2582]|uniref:hypothetical protein n=1 Tax=Amycolatopsis sp. MJM2582 TaxID=1427749 RepID=UPI000505FF31|nr:hypothetical protein [Amycolatopsis sp. MJM2582]KFZ79752.1 hypothetical protein ED92_20460 [Amycolatopsis sp. MJM2582]
MSADRDVSFIDRWGVEIEDDISVETFGALLDALNDDADAEHVVVDINDSDDWFVEFTRRSVCFQQAERGGEVVGTLDYADRDEALAIAKEFIDGDFEALRARSWKSDG